MYGYGERSSVGRAPDCDSGRRGFESHRSPHFFGKIDQINYFARVAELVDALDLGSSIERCESSSLSFRTILPVGSPVFGHISAHQSKIQKYSALRKVI